MSAVVGIFALVALGVGLFVFKDKIASFASGGLTDIGTNISGGIDQAGKDFDKFTKDQQEAFDKFVLDTQSGIDKTLTDINQVGIDAQGNVNQFLIDAQGNLDKNVADINAGIKTNVSDPLNQFGKDVQTNIINAQNSIDSFFASFGGQSPAKEVTVEMPKEKCFLCKGSVISERNFGVDLSGIIGQIDGVVTQDDPRNDRGNNTVNTTFLKDRPLNLSEVGALPRQPTKPTTISNTVLNQQQELSKKFGITTFDLSGKANFINGVAVSPTAEQEKAVEQVTQTTRATRFS